MPQTGSRTLAGATADAGPDLSSSGTARSGFSFIIGRYVGNVVGIVQRHAFADWIYAANARTFGAIAL
jgi:hypothetical protein